MQPVVIKVFGDKSKKLEPEQHRIEFPGGYISVDRTTDGEYWAHISINTQRATVSGSRIDFNHEEYRRRVESGEEVIPDIPGASAAEHFAIKFTPNK